MVEEKWLEVVCLKSGGCCDKKTSPSEWSAAVSGWSLGLVLAAKRLPKFKSQRERRNLGLCTDTSQTVRTCRPMVRPDAESESQVKKQEARSWPDDDDDDDYSCLSSSHSSPARRREPKTVGLRITLRPAVEITGLRRGYTRIES